MNKPPTPPTSTLAPAPGRPGASAARLALLAAALALGTTHFDLVATAAYRLAAPDFTAAPGQPSLGLTRYAADIEARPIQGLPANASGLTFSSATGTLFVAVNRPPAIAEISTEGALLRLLPMPGARDPEGITHVGGDLFVVADESDNRLHWVRIGPGDAAVRPGSAVGLAEGLGRLHNLGFEGVSWDEQRGELLVANEKWPRRVLRVRSLSPTDRTAPLAVSEWRPGHWPGILGGDLSSVTVHDASGNLLLLSDESALVSEYSRQGRLLGLLPLAPGRHGLTRAVPQAEGIALGPDDSLYIVSEPNLFYRFTPRR